MENTKTCKSDLMKQILSLHKKNHRCITLKLVLVGTRVFSQNCMNLRGLRMNRYSQGSTCAVSVRTPINYQEINIPDICGRHEQPPGKTICQV